MANKNISLRQMIGGGYDKFWNDKHFYRVVKGSRASKKSTTIAFNLIYRLMRYPWSNILVVRRYSNTNRDSTYSALKKAIHRFGVDELFRLNDGRPEIVYKPTGQKILFRGLDDPLKITSVDVDVGILSFAWFEEAFEIETQDKFETVVESIRGTYDDPEFFLQVTVSFNPWSDKHWLKRAFFDKETRYDDCYSTTTTYQCNEFISDKDKSRYEDLKRTNPTRYQVVGLGNWGITEGLVFEDNVHVVDFDISKKLKEIKTTCYGLDFGFSHDPTALISCIYDENNRELYIYDELYKTHLLSSQIVKEIDKRGLRGARIYADSAEPRTIAELKSRGVTGVRPAYKGKNSIRSGIDFMQDLRAIYIHPSCTHTVEEFALYCYAKDSNGNWKDDPEDANNHSIDAIRYALTDYIGRGTIKAKSFKKTLF